MKKIKNNLYTTITFITFSLAFAQYSMGQDSGQNTDPGAGDFGNDLNDTNPTDAPIDTYLWVLLVVGCLYVMYKYITFIENKKVDSNL